MKATLLSSVGSDRATGYAMSNKILRLGNRLLVGWLDGPAEPGGQERIQLGVCDADSGALDRVFCLGEGVDNHCGPALALDGANRVHAIVGAHSGNFLYRFSDDPTEPSSWSAPEPLGPFDTYPSLVVDAQDTLHLMSRESGPHPRKLIYRRKPRGVPWEDSTAMALSPRPGYTHFMHSLSSGPGGRLHLTLQYHYTLDSLSPTQAAGRCAAYLWSDDAGMTWRQEDGSIARLPLTFETTQGFSAAPEGGIRLSNLVVDSKDRPWVFLSTPCSAGGSLLRREESGWSQIPSAGGLDALDNRNGRETSLSRDAEGLIHCVIATTPKGAPSKWYDPRHELFHLVFDEEGHLRTFEQLTNRGRGCASWLTGDYAPQSGATTATNAPRSGAGTINGASWLPSLEHWDWVRPNRHCGLWMQFTQEHAHSAPGKPTNVFLTRLTSPNNEHPCPHA